MCLSLAAAACSSGADRDDDARAQPSAAPAPSCPPVTPLPDGSRQAGDWVDALVHEHVTYVPAAFLVSPPPTAAPAVLGPVVMTVRCRLADLTAGGDVAPPALDEGTATYLPVGTEVHAVAGFDPGCRLAARVDGRPVVYLAQDEAGGHAVTRPCALRAGAPPSPSS